MSTFSIVPIEHVCSGMELGELMRAGVISRYTAPRKVVRENGSEIYEYPLIGTTDDARPVWDC